MKEVTLSPKYQIVIPEAVRQDMHLKPGEKIQVFQYGNRIELVPRRELGEMRGFLHGINTDVPREKDRI